MEKLILDNVLRDAIAAGQRLGIEHRILVAAEVAGEDGARLADIDFRQFFQRFPHVVGHEVDGWAARRPDELEALVLEKTFRLEAAC
ncbi:hypothetical protein D3C87_1902200 [compost metagenome]